MVHWTNTLTRLRRSFICENQICTAIPDINTLVILK
nr:MAG TPA: hypothetical protein [Siphoviridae sp. ct8IY7]